MYARRIILATWFSLALGPSLLGGDCNKNAIDDLLEISLGMSPDCNGNSVPDECDISYVLCLNSTTFNTGASQSSAVAAGDIDGDGDIDLVTANRGSSNVSILLNDQNHTFLPTGTFSTGPEPTSIVVGDLNGDGAPDIVTHHKQQAQANVLLNNGSGAFAARDPPFPAQGEVPLDRLADLDGDGDLDLFGRGPEWFRNDGNGTFSTAGNFRSGVGGSNQIGAVGDFDGDGDLDIASPSSMFQEVGQVDIFWNSGAGTFSFGLSIVFRPAVYMVVASDFDRDGDLDLVAYNGSVEPWIVLNKGNRTFAEPTQLLSIHGFGGSILAADLDGDSYGDLILGCCSDSGFFVAPINKGPFLFPLGRGFGTIEPFPNPKAADLNGDGKIDLFAVNPATSDVVVMFNASTAPTSEDYTHNGIPDECEPDCNGNGKADSFDIATGASLDCNGDGIPDECGIPEECCPFRRGYDTLDRLFGPGELVGFFNSLSLNPTRIIFGGSVNSFDALDINDDGRVDLSDPVYASAYFFWATGSVPPEPFRNPGTDPTPDGIRCQSYVNAPAPIHMGLSFDFRDCPAEISGKPGETRVFEVSAVVSSREIDSGVQAWSLSLGAENLQILSSTTQGTQVDSFPSAWRFAQKVDPSLNTGAGPQGEGVVSAVVLSALHPDTLPPNSTAPILRIGLKAIIPAEKTEARIFFVDGKKGNGDPVENIVTVGGQSYSPLIGSCKIVLGPARGGGQIPADANQDSNLDLSDAVWLLGHLFLGTQPKLPCEGGTSSDPGPGDLSLVDVNGDGRIDLSDAVSLLGFLFLGTKPPVLGTSCVPIVGCPDNSEKCKP